MEIVKVILIPIYLIIALAVIILTLIQTKDDAGLPVFTVNGEVYGKATVQQLDSVLDELLEKENV